MAVEPEPYFAMYPEYQVKPDEWQAFMQDLQGCMIGRKLATKFGWKLGDRFFLESFIPPYRKSTGPSSSWCGGCSTSTSSKNPGTDTNVMFFHYKYLYEGTGRGSAARAPTPSRSRTPTRPAW